MSQELVGREPEVEALSAFVQRVGDHPSALVLSGEAGIGKSMLWQQGLELAAARAEVRVVSYRPAESEAELSFVTLEDLLAPILEDALPELPEPQRRALEVALLLAEGTAADVDHRTVCAAVLGTIRRAAEAGPLLLAIDDVQWIDRPSARALEYTVRRLGETGVSVLVAERTSLDEGPILLGLDRALGERLQRLRVGPLSTGAIHHLLRTRLDISFPRPTLVRLHEACGGNPFFALEIARALAERGEPLHAGEPLPIPRSLHELVSDRLRRLPPSTRRALAIAALATHPTVAVVEHALGDADRAIEQLSRAEQAGVIEVAASRISFAHPLLASTLLEGTSLADRRAAHRSLADVAEDPEARARHLALSSDRPDEHVAAALEEAARHAGTRGASDTAAELGELAIARTPLSDVEGVARRTIAAADHWTDAADVNHALSLLERAYEAAPPGPIRYAALWRLSERGSALDRWMDPLCQSLDDPDMDIQTRSAIHRVIAEARFLKGDLPRAASHARTAFREAEAVGDSNLEAQALAWVLLSEGLRGWRPDVQTRNRAMALDAAIAQTRVARVPSFWLGFLHMCRSELDAARSLMTPALDSATAIGDEFGRAEVLFHLTELECRAGNFHRAAELGRGQLELAEQLSLEQDLGGALFGFALAEAYLGNVEESRAAATKGLAMSTNLGDRIFEVQARRALGFLELSLGNLAGVQRWLADVPGLLRLMGVAEPGMFPYAPDLIETLVALGELDRATELLEELESRARELEHPWATATGWRCRALLCAARGDQIGATRAVEEGLGAHRAIPEPFELARMHLVAGAIQRRFKQKKAARESLEQALRAFEALSTPLWADKTRAELARIGLRAAEPGGLTPTERRMCELVVGGRTNQEIANELFVSVRTVEANLTRSYRKLGVRSRTELVTRMREGQP